MYISLVSLWWNACFILVLLIASGDFLQRSKQKGPLKTRRPSSLLWLFILTDSYLYLSSITNLLSQSPISFPSNSFFTDNLIWLHPSPIQEHSVSSYNKQNCVLPNLVSTILSCLIYLYTHKLYFSTSVYWKVNTCQGTLGVCGYRDENTIHALRNLRVTDK